MCLASRTACGSPSSTLSWQCLWWSLITHSVSQGARHPTMRVESVETGFTDPDWALLSGLSPAKQCIRYSWDKAFGTECVPIALFFLSRKSHPLTKVTGLLTCWVQTVSSFPCFSLENLLKAEYQWCVLSDIFQYYFIRSYVFYKWLFCLEAALQTTKGQGCDITN